MKKILSAAAVVIMLATVASAQTTYKGGNSIYKPAVSLVPTLKTITLSNNITLEYAEQGYTGGTPVIFLHGYSDSWHSFETVMPHLPENIHVFAISQRGHGDSDKPQEGYTPGDLANDLALFIKQKKLNKVIVAGHSYSGLVAQRFALDHPQLCKAIVMISSDAGFGDNPGMPEFLSEVDRLQEPVDRSFSEEFQRSTINKPISESYFNTVVDESQKVPVHVWKAISKQMRNVNQAHELKSITQPVLMFWGDKDKVAFKNDQAILMKNFKNARLLVYKNTGHALHWEEPKRFAEDLIKFVETFTTLKTITLSNNITLEYAEQGYTDGTPVIFLHGYTDSWHSYELVLPHLPENIHAFALTQRGHGGSDKPDAGYNPKDFANDVALFIKQKKLNKVIVVGHSLGGLVAQRFALDFPQHCKGVVIVSSDASFADNPGLPEFLSVVDELQDPIDRTFSAEFQKSTITKPISESYFNTVVDESQKVPAKVWRAIAQELRKVNYASELKAIKQPVMIMWGDKDGFCFKNDQDVMVKNIKKSKFVVYEGIGHALHWEEPARFANDLLKFVESFK